MTDNKPQRAPRLCVLIDADNIPAKYAKRIFDGIAALGEASVRRIYGDWSSRRLSEWHKVAPEFGLVEDQQSSNTTGKNASDIGLVIAAMDFLHSRLFDGFVLVSSDSDFTRLASRIREHGLDVYGIGEQKTPDAFRKACKRFIFVENLGTDDVLETQRDAPAAEAAKASTKPRGKAEAKPDPRKLTPTDVVPLVVAAMRAIGSEEEWYSLGQIGQYVTRANPDFDPRTYGSAKLSDLLRKAGRFELTQDETGHLKVRGKV